MATNLFTKVNGKKVYKYNIDKKTGKKTANKAYSDILALRTAPIQKLREYSGVKQSDMTDAQFRDIQAGRKPRTTSAQERAQRMAIQKGTKKAPQTISSLNKQIQDRIGTTGAASGNAMAGLTAREAGESFTKDTESAIAAAKNMRKGKKESMENFNARQAAAYRKAAEIKSRGEQEQYEMSSAEAQRESQGDLEGDFKDLLGEFEGTEQAKQFKEDRTEAEKRLDEQMSETEEDIKRRAEREQEKISRQEKATLAQGQRVGIVSNQELRQGIIEGGQTYLEDLARQDKQTMRDMLRQAEDIKKDMNRQEAAMFDSFVQGKVEQIKEQNAQIAAKQKQYEDRIMQFAQNNPDYDIDPQALMQGVVRLQSAPSVAAQMQEKLGQYGVNMQAMQGLAQEMGLEMDPNAMSKAIMTQAFADVGLDMPDGLFNEPQDSFSATLGLLKQMDEFKSPEMIRQISAAEQAKSVEDRTYDTALLDEYAKSLEKDMEPQQKFGTVKAGDDVLIYNQATGKYQRVSGTSNSVGSTQASIAAQSGSNVQSYTTATAPAQNVITNNSGLNLNYTGKLEVKQNEDGSFTFSDQHIKRKNGSQCGGYVNDMTGIGVGNSYASKQKHANIGKAKDGKMAVEGGIFMNPYASTGHIGMVEKVYKQGEQLPDGSEAAGGEIRIADYNRAAPNTFGRRIYTREQQIAMKMEFGTGRKVEGQIGELTPEQNIALSTFATQMGLGTGDERAAFTEQITNYMKNNPNIKSPAEAKLAINKKQPGALYTELDRDVIKETRTANKVAKERKRAAADGYKKLQALISENETGITDTAAIFTFMKTLDPTSVVRESEFETVRQSQSKWDTLKQDVQGIAGQKELLSPKLRKEILDSAKDIAEISENDYSNFLTETASDLEARGIVPDDAITGYERISQEIKDEATRRAEEKVQQARAPKTINLAGIEFDMAKPARLAQDKVTQTNLRDTFQDQKFINMLKKDPQQANQSITTYLLNQGYTEQEANQMLQDEINKYLATQ